MLAFCCSLAQADIPDPTRWHFEWTGFYDVQSHTFDNTTLRGSFGGIDANNNGQIETSELTELIINGVDYANCRNSFPSLCGVDYFSFKVGGELTFTSGYRNVFDTYSHSERYVAGDRITWVDSSLAGNTERTWLFTDQTSYLLTPVPEPQTWDMLAAGLLLLAIRRKGARHD